MYLLMITETYLVRYIGDIIPKEDMKINVVLGEQMDEKRRSR